MSQPGAAVYTYGLDDPMRLARTITVETEREAATIFAQATALGGLPVGYIVRANVRCNQLDTFQMIACDWSQRLESRRENVEQYSRRLLGTHLRHAHPYLDQHGRVLLQRAIQFNFKDVGR